MAKKATKSANDNAPQEVNGSAPKDKSNRKIVSPVVVALIGAMASVGAAKLTADAAVEVVKRQILAEQTQRQQDAQAARERDAALNTQIHRNAQKVCRVFRNSDFSDALVVPASWNRSHCQQLMGAEGANHWVMGCMFPDGIVFGTTDGGVPGPNCGWE